MLDAFDAMLYALVLTYVMRDLGMSKKTAGFLYTLTFWPPASAACFSASSPTASDASAR
jgi:hypothetical protein